MAPLRGEVLSSGFPFSVDAEGSVELPTVPVVTVCNSDSGGYAVVSDEEGFYAKVDLKKPDDTAYVDVEFAEEGMFSDVVDFLWPGITRMPEKLRLTRTES